MKVPLALALIFPIALTHACTRQPAAAARAEEATLTGACRVAAASNTGSDADITKLQQDLRDARPSARAAELLGYRFVAKARVSNDAGFYTLAEQAAACLESIQPGDPAALLLRGHVLHQLHRFGEAEVIARRLVTLREFVLDYGLLGDVLMEQGRLSEAAVAYQTMVDLKPFYQSYIRAAHLRWLKGDLDGAIALMQSAIRAVSPRDPESVAWAYSRLAVYELQRGQLAEASRMNDAALQHVPDYAAALLTRGRIQLAEKKYAAAATTLEKAASVNPLPEYRWALADALRSLDRKDEAARVYAFVSQRYGQKYLTTALAIYPHEEPGIGPNKYNFDDDVLYEIRVATGKDVAKGRTTQTYQFKSDTTYRNRNTILQSYLGVISDVGDASQNLIQRYTVDRVDEHSGRTARLGRGIVPPNNQGNATPRYNRNDDGEQPAKDGVGDEGDLDRYTSQAVADLEGGYLVFAGQRDDGFYADVQAIFDLLKLRPAAQAVDSQGGFNVHTIALNIPIDALGGDQQIVGVYATTSRRRFKVLDPAGDLKVGEYVQVARQGNPLFNEGLVAIKDKDLYSRTSPEVDATLFRKYALTPELAGLINALVLGANVAPTMNRTDIAGIFIPDLIKVDLSTGPARLAGGGMSHPTNPDDAGFSRLGIFGNDTLTSSVQAGFGNGTVPGGWPNGRRFGDDVVDIAVTALISDLRVSPPKIVGPAGDNVNSNDIAYNKVFPYAATPLNGRTHTH